MANLRAMAPTTASKIAGAVHPIILAVLLIVNITYRIPHIHRNYFTIAMPTQQTSLTYLYHVCFYFTDAHN
jgi:hypothetical protein